MVGRIDGWWIDGWWIDGWADRSKRWKVEC